MFDRMMYALLSGLYTKLLNLLLFFGLARNLMNCLQPPIGGPFMTNLLVTDVLVVGEGAAGQTAALAASEEGCKVIMLGDGRPPSTAVSTGVLTFAAHDGFTPDQVFEAMSQVTGKGLCDSPVLTRPLDEAPQGGRTHAPKE
jgi:hypothetical protein